MHVTTSKMRDITRAAERALNTFAPPVVSVSDEIEFRYVLANMTHANICDSASLEALRANVAKILGCNVGTMWVGVRPELGAFVVWAKLGGNQ